MKKNKAISIIKGILPIIICVAITLSLSIGVSAESVEDYGEITEVITEEAQPGAENNTDAENDSDTTTSPLSDGESDLKNDENQRENTKNQDTLAENPNIFDEIYSLLEVNADKIFSALAFISTLVVALLYKSRLIPLLRDALSRLKASIDSAQEENNKNSIQNSGKIDEISSSVANINLALEENSKQIGRIKWEFEGYSELLRERSAMRTLLESQIDLLYAIFMTSALPQYQKDEIGEKIQKMREELAAYEIQEN